MPAKEGAPGVSGGAAHVEVGLGPPHPEAELPQLADLRPRQRHLAANRPPEAPEVGPAGLVGSNAAGTHGTKPNSDDNAAVAKR